VKWLALALVVLYSVFVMAKAVAIAPALPDAIRGIFMNSDQQNPHPAPAGAAPASGEPAAVPGSATTAVTTATGSEWPFSAQVDVNAKPNGLWTVAREFINGPARIRFAASESWKYSPDSSCGPDGDMLSMISPIQTILKSAPVGSLIAKIGGSSAGQADGTVYLVGSFAIIDIGADVKGPLYLTINDDPSGFGNNSGSLKVNMQWKPVAVATQTAPAVQR
jgi:hypothetical protein